MNTTVIVYFIIGLLFAAYSIGFSYQQHQLTVIKVIVPLLVLPLLWPLWLFFGLGQYIAASNKKLSQMEDEHNRIKQEVEKVLNKR